MILRISDEPSSENINSDKEIRITELYSSFTEPQETDIQNNKDSKSGSVSEKPSLNKTEQAYDSNANNLKIQDSFLAGEDDIVIFIIQDREPCDDHIC